MQASDHPVHLIAHRGYSTRFPENTLAAFAAAIEAGAQEIEFDVQHTKDNIAIICHDDTLDRTTTLGGRCVDYKLEEIQQATIKDPRHPERSFPGMQVPTLEDVLSMFGGLVGMNVHFKHPAADGHSFKQLVTSRAFEARQQHSLYVAGGADVLSAAREQTPELDRCCLMLQHDPLAQLQAALDYQCVRLQFRNDPLKKTHVDACLQQNIIPNLFYCDDPHQAEQYLNWGIKGLLTNDVGFIQEHLTKHKQPQIDV